MFCFHAWFSEHCLGRVDGNGLLNRTSSRLHLIFTTLQHIFTYLHISASNVRKENKNTRKQTRLDRISRCATCIHMAHVAPHDSRGLQLKLAEKHVQPSERTVKCFSRQTCVACFLSDVSQVISLICDLSDIWFSWIYISNISLSSFFTSNGWKLKEVTETEATAEAEKKTEMVRYVFPREICIPKKKSPKMNFQ